MGLRGFSLLLLFRGDEAEGDLLHIGFQLAVLDPGGIQHPLGGQVAHGILVLVGKVQHFLHAALDNGLGALVAGEQGHIQLAAPQIPAVGIDL